MKSRRNGRTRRLRPRCVLWLLPCLLLVAGASHVGAYAASTAEYDAGFDYKLIDPPATVPGAEPGKVTVVEFFWYGCPHCYRFEPYLDKWLEHKPDYVQFIRIPAPLNPTWTVHARAYYAAQELGVLPRLFQPLFDAIQRQGPALATEDALAGFFTRHGVKPAAFRAAYGSFSVDAKVRRARALAQRVGVTGVPTLMVAGQYRTSLERAGSDQRLIDIVAYLARKAAAERRGAARLKSAGPAAANQSGAH